MFSCMRKCVKACVCMCCIIGFVYQTTQFALMYLEYPIVLDTQVLNPSRVPLPGITFCTNNPIRRNVFCSRSPGRCEKREDLVPYCDKVPHFCENDIQFPKVEVLDNLNNISIQELISLAPEAESMLDGTCYLMEYSGRHKCSYNTAFKANRDYVAIQHNCFRATFLKDEDTFRNVSRTSGLIIPLGFEQEEYILPKVPVSIQLQFHEPSSFVNPYFGGFEIKPGRLYDIFLKIEEKWLLPYPFSTNCTDYIAQWRSRGKKGPSTQEMCIEDCKKTFSLNNCNCTDTRVQILDGDETLCPSETICVTEENIANCYQRCSQECHSIKFSTEIKEKEVYRAPGNKHSFYDRKRGVKAGLVIGFQRTDITVHIYRAQYQSIEILSYVGGYVGIWLGISLVTLFNFVETAVIDFPSLLGKKEKLTIVKPFNGNRNRKKIRVI